ncbi:MAG: hypothetical protein AAF487_01910 [Bacteroidota bacterium]
MKRILTCIALILMMSQINAQSDYERAIGIRAGFDNGITYKQFITSVSAIEALAFFGNNSFNLTGLYELNNENAFQVDRLDWYYGGGGHIGFYTVDGEDGDSGSLLLGVDGIIGIEYNFEQAPINVSLDWKPQINLIGGSGFVGDTGALSLRYIF